MGFVLTIIYIVVTIISPEQFGKDWATYHALMYLAGITFLASLPSLAESRYWKSIQLFLLIGLIIAIGLSQLLNGWLGGVLEGWRAFLPSAAVFFFIVVNVTTPQRLKIATLAAVASCLIVAVEALCGYYAGFQGEMFILRTNVYSPQEDVIGQLIRLRGAGFLSDPNDLAQILLIALPLIFIAWQKKHMIANFFFVLAPVAILLWCTYLTHSRGGLIALAAVTLMAARKKLGTTASTIIAVTFVFGMLALDFTGGRGISASDGADRLEAWASGLEMFKSSPLYGVGFNNFADIFGITAHNSFVLCLAELGLLGSTLWMALLVTTTISLNRIIGGRKPRLAKLFGFVPIFESRYIGTAGALHSAVALSAPGIMAMSEVNTGERAVTIEAASAAENEIPIELHSSPVVPMQWIEVIRLALISFMATAWFLSRSYTTTMYLVLGLATAAIALEESDSKTTDRGHWIFLSVAAEVVLVVLIYFLVRLRHP